MQLTSRLHRSLNQPAAAGALLGAEHPLSRVLDRLTTVLRQALVAAALLALSVSALVANMQNAHAYVIAAAVLQAGLLCRAALLQQALQALVLDLIIAGRGNVSLPAVERCRRELLRRRTQVRLAASVESVLIKTLSPTTVPATGPALLMNPKVIAPLADELRAVVALLRQGSASPRGVALAERLLTDGRSALYGHDPVALREELGRLRYLLASMPEANQA